MRTLILRVAVSAALVVGGVAIAGPVAADGCLGSNLVVWGNGGGRCDYDLAPDGSFTRCDTVFVLGIGGTNCYWVPPGTPHT